MKKRGQTPIEFFFSYGWALIVIILVASLVWVYLGVECGRVSRGFLGQQIGLQDCGSYE